MRLSGNCQLIAPSRSPSLVTPPEINQSTASFMSSAVLRDVVKRWKKAPRRISTTPDVDFVQGGFGGVEGGVELLAQRRQDGVHQVGLVVEVTVEAALGDPCRAGDLVDARCGQPGWGLETR